MYAIIFVRPVIMALTTTVAADRSISAFEMYHYYRIETIDNYYSARLVGTFWILYMFFPLQKTIDRFKCTNDSLV